MAKLNINPTRMELLKLKVKLQVALRGHKLLKEKRDSLMREFLTIIKQAKELREKIEKDMSKAFEIFIFAATQNRREVIEEALICPAKKISLSAKIRNITNVRVPQFELLTEGDFLSYGLATTPSDLDESLIIFEKTIKEMVALAEIEHSAHLLSQEIERTRRRVNALEYVFIPNIRVTIKYITVKLDEQERSAMIALMQVKKAIA